MNGMNDVISRQAAIDVIKTSRFLVDAMEKVIKLPSVQPEQRWIPVSERLPNEFADVLCCTDSDEIFIARYLGKMNDGTDCFDDDDGMMWEGDVIAWMPLPKAYCAESEGARNE